VIQSGGEAFGCTEAKNAMQVLRQVNPHLVVYDDLMTGMRAWKFGFILTNLDIPRPYIVALSDFPTRLQKVLCEENGVDEYVQKPIMLETLEGWIEKAKKKFGVTFDLPRDWKPNLHDGGSDEFEPS
jgi:DNA-binding response OmpR family regulator